MVKVESTPSDVDGEARASQGLIGRWRVTVAVLTYLRTEELPDTVRALLVECATVPSAGVLVIDNNPLGDAERVLRALQRSHSPHSLRYVHEPRPGIAAARNRAISESAEADVLVFIDDDERPTAGWLRSLVRLYDQRRPAAIAGPVVSEFAGTVDPWIAAGRFFTRRRMPTGSVIDVAATNNLLLDTARLRSAGLEFDDRFGLTGGEDTLLTKQLVSSGGTILWCDEAVVIDRVPESRLTRRWVLQKAFSMGNALPRVDLALTGSRSGRLAVRMRYAIGGIARLTTGVVRAGVGAITRSLAHRARGSRMAVRGVGMLLGSAGYTHLQYGRQSAARSARRVPRPCDSGCARDVQSAHADAG